MKNNLTKILSFLKSSKKENKQLFFGKDIKYNDKSYKYLYTCGSDDNEFYYLYCEETTSIYMIPSKYIDHTLNEDL